MTIDAARFHKLLGEFKLEPLFNELGWERASLKPQAIAVNGEAFTLTQVAHKRGVAVFRCSPDNMGKIPARPVLLKIEKETAKIAHEHLLVFTDAEQSTMTWLWVSRMPGQPATTRTHTWHKGQSGESLRQKLTQIVWSLEEEEAITLTDVITGLRNAFDRDKISKGFYDKFKAQHEIFAKFIEGLKSEADQAWYASLMLNRLMFVYFIQKKGFLDGNENYLGSRMAQVQAAAGKGNFHSFYRQFLRRLFHEGLGQAKAERNAELAKLVGDVPYLNGGLFSLHELEEANPGLDVPDEAFENLFAFFDAWDWHLDDRPLSSGKEINPDVLGYIFEKYINQKQMGAYYTKEDITEYISKNTVIPHLLDQARERCKVAFDGDASVWNLLKTEPDRYLYPAMKTGVIDANGDVVPESVLPDFVQAGMKDAKARMFERRYNLGEVAFHTSTGERGTLPTETWREYAERRSRCLAVRDKLASGEVKSADDLITLNLDIRQFMQDVVETSSSPDLLRAVWQAIVGRVPEKANEKIRHGITVLDPTCGSGAFLFAALNVLEPLYEACLDRMESFVEDAKKLGKAGEIDFVKVLAEVDKHPSRRYYIYKNIILQNLFGVDIMAEAVEICKLRLFLKLVSQVDAGRDLEPLPDIDFNIRAGNTLVGYATEAQFDASENLASDKKHRTEIKASTADLADLFDRFREQQTRHGGKVTADDKRKLRDKLNGLSLELDKYLAHDYGIDPDRLERGKKETKEQKEKLTFPEWRESHQPFHWFAEFYGVMRDGGFDVVIGNPPYVELAKIKEYSIPAATYTTLASGNLYAPMMERALSIACQHGYFGQIVPMSCVATARMQSLRNLWVRYQANSWLSHYSGDAHPSVLFNGVKFRLTIVLQKLRAPTTETFTTTFQRWFPEGRQALFQLVDYARVSPSLIRLGIIPKANATGLECLGQLASEKKQLGTFVVKASDHTVYAHRIVAHYVKAFDFVPFFRSERDGEKKSEDYKPFPVSKKAEMQALAGILNSSQFYVWFVAFSDVYHCGRELILDYPCDISKVAADTQVKSCAKATMKAFKKTAVRRSIPYKRTGIVEYDEFYPRQVKREIDRLDVELGRITALSADHLDFIINYDIKYRMGSTDEDE